MKTWLCYAFAVSLAAAPIGWITAGILRAGAAFVVAPQVRPFYVEGNYSGAALLSALIAGGVLILVGAGRQMRKG